jgi:hypothetical protein
MGELSVSSALVIAELDFEIVIDEALDDAHLRPPLATPGGCSWSTMRKASAA